MDHSFENVACSSEKRPFKAVGEKKQQIGLDNEMEAMKLKYGSRRLERKLFRSLELYMGPRQSVKQTVVVWLPVI